MSLTPEKLREIADTVMAAQDSARAIGKLTDRFPELGIAEGYAVQDECRRRWIARGDRQVGVKAGLTSKAKMDQMGVDLPGFGLLMASMARPENGAIEIDELIHPRIEAEIAFVLGDDLEGPDLTLEQVMAATDYVIPAVEVIDSRFENFKFDLPSVIADNTSSARYVTGGRPRSPAELDLRTIGVVIEKNGEIQALGASAAVLNHPAKAVAMLARHLSERGQGGIPAGSLILTGGITEAIPVTRGDNVIARFQDMGSISFRFV